MLIPCFSIFTFVLFIFLRSNRFFYESFVHVTRHNDKFLWSYIKFYVILIVISMAGYTHILSIWNTFTLLLLIIPIFDWSFAYNAKYIASLSINVKQKRPNRIPFPYESPILVLFV